MKKQCNRIVQSLMWATAYMNDLSLFTGKMGMAIFFFEYGEYSSQTIYHNFANELIEEIYEDITYDLPLSFEKGLAGIGWGMIYLVKKKYVEGDIDEILVSIDEMLLSSFSNDNSIYHCIEKYVKLRSESVCFQKRARQLAPEIENYIHVLQNDCDFSSELIQIINSSDTISEKKESGLNGLAGQILKQIYDEKQEKDLHLDGR